jgi:hypothetical protein
MQTKSILILGRNDPNEAMRVAAGLTIFGHEPGVIFLLPVPDTAENADMLELLEFSDIEAKSMVASDSYTLVSPDELVSAILAADELINI